MATSKPVWGADCPISMPQPAEEPALVGMYGFAFTQYRLVHDITGAEYEALAVPVYAPSDPSVVVYGDAAIDGAT